MSNPVTAILNRCDTGFFLWQKLLITGLSLVYIASPIDLVPDVFLILGWGDDAFVLYFLVRVWASPTLPQPTSTLAPSLVPRSAVEDAARAARRRVQNLHETVEACP